MQLKWPQENEWWRILGEAECRELIQQLETVPHQYIRLMTPDDDDDTIFSIAMAGVKLYLGNNIFKQSFNVSPITGRQRLDYQSR